MPANNSGVMSASPSGHAGTVSGLLNMARGLGTALGVAVAGALYAAVTRASHASAGHASAVDPGSGLAAALVALGALALATGLILLLRRATLADVHDRARGLVGHWTPQPPGKPAVTEAA
jgi:hypothetical protein